MRYRPSWVDLNYEAAFRLPLFAVSGQPLNFAGAMCASLRPVAVIAARDISITRHSDADTRVKATFFAGNANLEFGPDSLSVVFRNPHTADDLDVIKKVVTRLQGFLHEQASMSVPKAETVTVRAFLELVDEPKNAQQYLCSLYGDSKLYAPSVAAVSSLLSPGIRFDIEDTDNKWTFNFELSRAVRNRSEVFVLTTTQFPAESKVSDTDARATLIDQLVVESMKRVGLEPARVTAGTSEMPNA